LQGEKGSRGAVGSSTQRCASSSTQGTSAPVHASSSRTARAIFLEVNARLQVEHPVTEMVTGLDLVELQLRVAAGDRLPDLSNVHRRGHAIEARLYAEDPSRGFIPRPGAIDELVWAGGVGEAQTPTLRVESGVRAGSKVTPYYDPMIAKLIAWGETREAAIDELDRALAGTTIAPCTTNIAFLRKVLASPDFRAGRYDTGFAEALAKSR
jgi:acetyl/propionyl-CoA carboxylase alpha subunit